MKVKSALILAVCSGSALLACAQQKAKPEDTEFYEPVPKVVKPANSVCEPTSDAIVLFDGKNLDHWVSSKDNSKQAQWTVSNGVITVKKGTGNIQTKEVFTDYQLHIEWRIPKNITGKGQARGNSGIFLAAYGSGDGGYELQVLDSYNNTTYVNGQAGSIYKQHIPLANPMRPPGEWNMYDVAWKAPVFNEDGSVKSPARVTVFLNGILIQNNVEIQGETKYIGKPEYYKHGPAPIKLQDHGDPSEPISFRNIWVRPV